MIQVPATKLSTLIYGDSSLGESVLIPISSWMRQQLNILDCFLKDNVVIPQDLLSKWPFKADSFYKPIYNGRNMQIVLCKYCRFTQAVGDELVIDVPCKPRPNFGHGLYSFTVELPHVFIGPHKTGFLYSVNFRVVRIHYQSDPAGTFIPPAVKVVSSDKVTDQQSTESSAEKV